MHAVVVTATIAAGQVSSSQKVLREEVVPRVRQSPGFVKGFWTVNSTGTQGISMTVFDTKANAEGAADRARAMAPPPGVTLNTIEIREVVAEG